MSIYFILIILGNFKGKGLLISLSDYFKNFQEYNKFYYKINCLILILIKQQPQKILE